MGNEVKPSLALSPGMRLVDLLQERGLKQAELAAVMGRPPQYVHDIIKRKKAMDARVALELEEALDEPSANQWLQWELDYQRSVVLDEQQAKGGSGLKRKDVMEAFPFALEAVRLGWIEDSRNPESLRSNITSFLQRSDTMPSLRQRFSTELETVESSLKAWNIQVVGLASAARTPPYDSSRFTDLVNELKVHAQTEDGAEYVPAILRRYGITLIVLPSLKKAPVDGVASLSDGRPFVGLSLRHGQIDRFWFVLMHELAHIFLGHKDAVMSLDNYDRKTVLSKEEEDADRYAQSWLLDEDAYRNFAFRGPHSLESIETFSATQGVHRAIVIGRLKTDGWLSWHEFAREHPSVRDHLMRGVKSAAAE